MSAYKNGHVGSTKDFEPTVLTIEDRLPKDFPAGTFYKNGSGGYTADDGVQYMHPFDCSGKVLAISLDPTSKEAVYRYKYVETPKYQQDLSTGTMSERGFFGTNRAGGIFGNIGRGLDPMNVANTNIVASDDKDSIFALWEAGRPFEMDARSLETRGEYFGEFLNDKLSFSAHPKYDPRRKTFTNFCISRPEPGDDMSTVVFQEIDAKTFQPVGSGVSLIFPGLIPSHDMALTENYIIFHWNESRVNGPNALKALLGLQPPFSLLETPAQETSKYVLIPRELLLKGTDEEAAPLNPLEDPRIRMIDTPFHAALHFTNGYEKLNGNLVFEACCFQSDEQSMDYGVDVMIKSGKPLWDAFDYDSANPTTLEQFEIDPANNKLLRMDTISDHNIEFPQIPVDMLTKPHQYVYSLGAHNTEYTMDRPPANSPFGSLRKINVETKEQDVFSFEPYEFVQDGDVARKVGSTKEDAVYLVTVVTNGRDLTTDLVILDGEDVAAGPVVRLRLPEIVPIGGLHGNYYEGLTYN